MALLLFTFDELHLRLQLLMNKLIRVANLRSCVQHLLHFKQISKHFKSPFVKYVSPFSCGKMPYYKQENSTTEIQHKVFCILSEQNHHFWVYYSHEKPCDVKPTILLVKEDFHVYKHSCKYGLRTTSKMLRNTVRFMRWCIRSRQSGNVAS